MKPAILKYLEALKAADLEALLNLFAAEALVHSPLYGSRKASLFYRNLLADTRTSELKPLDVFINTESRTAALHFLYEWTMRDGSKITFDCVDIFSFDESGKISDLKIIYDTAATRPLFEALHPPKPDTHV